MDHSRSSISFLLYEAIFPFNVHNSTLAYICLLRRARMRVLARLPRNTERKTRLHATAVKSQPSVNPDLCVVCAPVERTASNIFAFYRQLHYSIISNTNAVPKWCSGEYIHKINKENTISTLPQSNT